MWVRCQGFHTPKPASRNVGDALVNDPSKSNSVAVGALPKPEDEDLINHLVRKVGGEMVSFVGAMELESNKGVHEARPMVYSKYDFSFLDPEEEEEEKELASKAKSLTERHQAALRSAKATIKRLASGKLVVDLDDTEGVSFVAGGKSTEVDEKAPKVAVKLNGKGEPNELVEVDLSKHILAMEQALAEKEDFSNQLHSADDFDKDVEMLVNQLNKLDGGSEVS